MIEICDLNHPALEPYRELRHRNWIRQSGIFIAEGPLVVQRLLDSNYDVESVLLDRKYFDQYSPIVPESVKLLVVEHELVERIVGFNFHRGVLACGRRQKVQFISDQLIVDDPRETMVGLVGIEDPENVGGILRSAAGFGVRRVLIGPGTADPLSRRSLRVAMGNSLGLEFLISRDLPLEIVWLKKHGVEVVATTLGDGAESLETVRRAGASILLLGNERHGLPSEIYAQVDRKVRIDMALNTDSLNVSAAAAVVMYHFCRVHL